jgi:hypothetical protein
VTLSERSGTVRSQWAFGRAPTDEIDERIARLQQMLCG